MTPPNDAETAAALREILDSAEFQPSPKNWLIQRLSDLLYIALRFLDSLSVGTLLAVAAGAAIALIFIGRLVLRAIGSSFVRTTPRVTSRAAAIVAPPLTATDLAQRANELRAAGDLRGASRALHQSLLLTLSADAGLPWRPTLSDWEWLALLPASPPLVEFTRHAERLEFGAEIDASDFDACSRLYRELTGPPA